MIKQFQQWRKERLERLIEGLNQDLWEMYPDDEDRPSKIHRIRYLNHLYQSRYGEEYLRGSEKW